MIRNKWKYLQLSLIIIHKLNLFLLFRWGEWLTVKLLMPRCAVLDKPSLRQFHHGICFVSESLWRFNINQQTNHQACLVIRQTYNILLRGWFAGSLESINRVIIKQYMKIYSPLRLTRMVNRKTKEFFLYID